MKKAFIVSDVHGFFDLMIDALTEAGFEKDNPDHIFVSLGDLLDRGHQPYDCLQFVSSLPDDRKILIRGNHEDLMVEMLDRGVAYSHDRHNGTDQTVADFYNLTEISDMESPEIFSNFGKELLWKDYINSCIDFWEDDKSIFVHGWIPVLSRAGYFSGRVIGPEYTDDWRTMHWKDARWYNGMELWNAGIRVPGKTIYCGHWHCSWGHSNLHLDGEEFLKKIETCWIDSKGRQHPYVIWTPFEDEGICAIDACTVISNKVNCKTINIDV